MTACERWRSEWGRYAIAPVDGTDTEARSHLRQCPACRGELMALRRIWTSLPVDPGAAPPIVIRERIRRYAHRAAAPRTSRRAGIVRRVVREVLAPVTAGSVVAAGIVALVHFRGAAAPVGTAPLIALSLILATGLAFVTGAFLRAPMGLAQRIVLTTAIGALGGFVLLTIGVPITDTATVCGNAVFGTDRLTLGEMCAVYSIVTPMYAAIPMAVAAYVRDDTRIALAARWPMAILFTGLALPLVVLQAGIEQWLVLGVAVLGFAAGAWVGHRVGAWTRSWTLASSTR